MTNITREQIADIIAAKVKAPPATTRTQEMLHRLEQLTAADLIIAAMGKP